MLTQQPVIKTTIWYGFNPTMTCAPSDRTRIKLSYEYFHDDRTADRGIPSQFGRPYVTNPSTFFGNPALNRVNADAHIATFVLEHEFDLGLKLKNQARYAHYEKFYQNIFPGGPVNAAGTAVSLSAYNNQNNRENFFNQTDVTYKFATGFMSHTLLAGAEVGRQISDNFRQTRRFNGISLTEVVNPLFPTSYTPVVFGNNGTTDANGRSILNLAVVYVQDQVQINQYLQLIGGLRFDHFDLNFVNRNTATTFNRVDNLVSPRAGFVVKPVENVSLYSS